MPHPQIEQQDCAICFKRNIFSTSVTFREPGMRGTVNQDMRVKRTLDNIQAAFRKLVLENAYSDITVSALCTEAMIGRKTFYVYFESLDELLEHTLEALTKKYIERIRNYVVPEDLRAITREFYLFSVEQGKFYDNLVCSENFQTIGSRLLMRFVRGTWAESLWFSSLHKNEQDILVCFIYNTGAGLYRQWVLDGKKIPLEEMIGYADILLSRGIEGFKHSREC